MTHPTNQPVERSLDWHLSYLREHMHDVTEFKRRATVAMHFAQYPHLYAHGEVCRLYVEASFFGLTLRDYLGTMAQNLERWAWVVAAMTPNAWTALLSLWADIGAAHEIERRSYEAALMYAWVPSTQGAFYPFSRRFVCLEHGHVEAWGSGRMMRRGGFFSYIPQSYLTDAQRQRLLTANPGWMWDRWNGRLCDRINNLTTAAKRNDFPAFVTRVVRDPRILGIVEVSP